MNEVIRNELKNWCETLNIDDLNEYDISVINIILNHYDELIEALQLSALEIAILDCYMNGMVQSEVCAELGIGRGTINFRKASIRKRYCSLYGEY